MLSLPLVLYSIGTLYEGIHVVSGYPSSPDVTYTMEPHSIRFSWSASLTDSTLYYAVDVITADYNATINTTDTVLLLQPGSCQFAEYRVEIAAVNIVGVGEKYTSPPLSLEGNYSITSLCLLFNNSIFCVELTLSGANIIFGKNYKEINIQV